MDAQERKKYGLPADYVTIHMLRERWLQKQQEQKLKENQEQEALAEAQILEKDSKNQPDGEMEVCNRFVNDGPRERVGKDGGEIARVEEKGKGKKKIGWSGNGSVANKRYRGKIKNPGADWKKKNGDTLEVKVEDTEKRQNPRPKEGIDLVGKKIGPKGVEIHSNNNVMVGIAGFASGESSGTRRIGKIVSVGVAEVLPKNAVSEGGSAFSTARNVRKDGLRGGFHRNENKWDEGFSGNNSLGTKVEDEVLEIDRKPNRRKWKKREGKGGKFKQSGAEMSGLKLNEFELKPEAEKSGIGNEGDCMKGVHSGTGRNGVKQQGVDEVELKPEDKKSEIGNEGGRMKGLYSGSGRDDINQNGDNEVELKLEEEKFETYNEGGRIKGLLSGTKMNDIKQNEHDEVELKHEDEKTEIGNEEGRMKGLRSKLGRNNIGHNGDNEVLLKPKDIKLDIGDEGGGMKGLHSSPGRNDIEQNGVDEVKLKPEGKNLEIGNEGDHVKGLHSGTRRNDIKQNGVDGEVLAADTLVLENIVKRTVLAEKSRNDGFRGYGNWREHLKEKFENLTVGNRKKSYLGSKVETKFGGNRRLMNSGRFGGNRNMKQRDRSMVWVKKEQSGAVGGEASFVGFSPD